MNKMFTDTIDIKSVFWLFSAFSFILGSCIGSFMNVVVWRLPRGESLLYPPSHCPKCGHAIRPWENIPIISWLCLKARCSNCHLPISIKYPLGEGATGLLFAFLWMRIFQRGLPLECIPTFFFLGGALLAAALIDAEHRFIPDQVTYSGILFALLMAIVLPSGRLALLPQPNPHAGTLIFTGVKTMLLNWRFDLTPHPLTTALIDCTLGAAMGYAILALFAWSTRRLFGNVSKSFRKPVPATITKEGIRLHNTFRAWEDVLDSIGDTLIIHGTLPSEKNIAKITANAKGFSIDGKSSPWEATSKKEIKIERIATTRDVIGYGDVKLLAMIGAFLGADATIYILLTAALLAIFYAIASMLFHRRFIPSLPFGPFLAIATLLWMLFGNIAFLILS
ncbi:MAG: prepilin peptidase [Victivallales bacterium]|nr:prepilin peptidase [Victivallales bacterium]